MQERNLADRYGLEPLRWDGVVATLEAGFDQAPGGRGPDRHTCWLTTLDPDGAPHVTGIGALWDDGRFWFETGRTTRKGRNLDRDPRCALSVALADHDLVVEGTAAVVADPDVVARLARMWAEDWPVEVDESGVALTAPYSAPSAGAPPWTVYRVDARRATALRTAAPGGATSWTF